MSEPAKFSAVPILESHALTLRHLFGMAWGLEHQMLAALPDPPPPAEMRTAFDIYQAGFLSAFSLCDTLTNRYRATGDPAWAEGLGRVIREAVAAIKAGNRMEPEEFGL